MNFLCSSKSEYGSFTCSKLCTTVSITVNLFAPSLSLSLPYSYLVSHINDMQALVIVEHNVKDKGRFYNLYLSEETGVYFSLSLRDIVIENDRNVHIDLELVRSKCRFSTFRFLFTPCVCVCVCVCAHFHVVCVFV